MNTPRLRSIAALALVSLLPRASALTVTQTATVGTSGGSSDLWHGAGITNFAFAPFNAQLGTLQSVTITSHTTGFVGVVIVNDYRAGPSLVSNTADIITEFGGLGFDAQRAQSINTPLLTLDYLETQRINLDFASQFTETFSALPVFTSTQPRMQISDRARFNEATWGIYVQATTNITISYNYIASASAAAAESVSDSGTALLLMIPIAGCLALHRRRIGADPCCRR